MLPQETIIRKRDGGPLSEAEIASFIGGVVDGSVTEGQIAALCMAVLLRGMTMDERVALTRAMAESGSRIDWSEAGLGGPVLEKHSTGGIGDKVSLVLAPVVAACGGFVPMISGRGLGHTGGTLDKLDAIPGYVSQPDLPRLRQVVREAGCAIIGATGELAPADRRIYAVRDVTGTVESLDLITASILSKKLAGGADALVMDVKFGSGAFRPKLEDATALARSIASVANGAGLPTVSLLTDMNQVLGRTAGNALEVVEACDVLTGKSQDARLWGVTRALSAELLVLGGLEGDLPAAEAAVDRALESGKAAERFGRMVAALDGPRDFLERYPSQLARAPVVEPVHPEEAGYVAAVDTRAVGLAIVAMGGGRTRPEDSVDHAVGLSEVAGVGEEVGPDRPIALIHARHQASAGEAATAIRSAYRLAGEPVDPGPLIRDRIS